MSNKIVALKQCRSFGRVKNYEAIDSVTGELYHSLSAASKKQAGNLMLNALESRADLVGAKFLFKRQET